MKRIAVFSGVFDPITIKDTQDALKLLKSHQIDKVAFKVIKDHPYYQDRINMVKLAIKPYRRLCLYDEKLSDVTYIDFDLTETSNKIDDFNDIKRSVKHYILQNELYIKDILKRRLSKKRYEHVNSAAVLAVTLAKHYNINTNSAYLAAILHDYTKELSTEKQTALMKIYYPEKLDKHPKTYHQYTAMTLVKQDFGIYQQDIIDAIGNHVNGTDHKRLSKIIYCVDKIDDTRKIDNTFIKALCFKDIDKAYMMIKEKQEQYLNGGKNE
ncbi:MAG: bis(5'-nucleosyl)-tetraphosphatase (symmetrical) YqeK [Erysipelotrichaceae bacterium]|nr:bis(5'-nucleosyl)-tetraphosphatase (symmetrical) YqeK [Erysipelotrichaceae bacterium]